MKKEELKNLFKKYSEGTASEEEKALLETWYLEYNEPGPPISRKKIDAVKDLIFMKLPGNENGFQRIGLRLAAAVVIIGILITATYMLVERSPSTKTLTIVNDVLPGTNKAVLALASGEKLNLSDASNGKLLQKQGINIVKTKAGQILFEYTGKTAVREQNTISTPSGGQWQIRLPDGSQVWLNAASSLTFPTSFDGSQNRIVTLNGEGYFEVAKNANHPFIVISGDQRVEVLGTHFNINSYSDEPTIKTTLLEGRVQVSLLNNDHPTILKPGEQSTATRHHLEIHTVDTDEAMAWKNGYFQFDDEPISSIMRKLRRWYNVQVDYEGIIPTEGVNGRISRNKNISQVIKALEATKAVHLKLEGRRITVMK